MGRPRHETIHWHDKAHTSNIHVYIHVPEHTHFFINMNITFIVILTHFCRLTMFLILVMSGKTYKWKSWPLTSVTLRWWWQEYSHLRNWGSTCTINVQLHIFDQPSPPQVPIWWTRPPSSIHIHWEYGIYETNQYQWNKENVSRAPVYSTHIPCVHAWLIH